MNDTSTVLAGGFEISSNNESPSDMVQALTQPKESSEPRILTDKGKEVDKEREEEIKVSEAAAALGKKGGKAAAEARKAQEAVEEPEEKPTEETSKDEPPAKEGEEEPGKLGKPRHDPIARMREATRKEAEAKRERDAAKAEADSLRRERDALKAQGQPAQKAPEPTGKPVRAQFASDEEYVEAIADWKAEEKVKAYKTETEQANRVKEYTQTVDSILGRAVAARNEHLKADPDFWDKVSEDVKRISLMPSFARDLHEQLTADHIIADEIIHAEKQGPLVQLHLSENPDELQRLQALKTPADIQVEMRLLARSLNGAVTTVPAPKGSSKAKPPVRPVTGAPAASDPDIHGDIDFDTFAARRMKKKA